MLKSSRSSLCKSNIVYSEQVNNSKSKMMYSFAKSLRFTPSPNDRRQPLYLPSMKSRRGTSFGFGNKKYQSHSTQFVPGPNKYETRYDMYNKNKAKTFGTSRAQTKMNSFLNESLYSIPGPSHYNPKNNSGKCLKYSMRVKSEMSNQKLSYPAPGDYKTVSLIGTEGKKILSQYKTNAGNKFNKLPRMLNPQSITPGPGYYESKKQISQHRYSYTSGFGISGGRRKYGGIYQQKYGPGPGSYNHYTEFHSRQL